MEQNTNGKQPSSRTNGKWYDFIWPSLVGVLLAKLFGLIGALAAMGIYFGVKPRLGTAGAVVLSAIGGAAVAFIAAQLLRSM